MHTTQSNMSVRKPLAGLSVILAVIVIAASCMLQSHHHSEDGRVCVCAIEHTGCDDGGAAADADAHGHSAGQCPKISVWENPGSMEWQSLLSPVCVSAGFDALASDPRADSRKLCLPPAAGTESGEARPYDRLRAPPVRPIA